jgi:hypothetical protein
LASNPRTVTTNAHEASQTLELKAMDIANLLTDAKPPSNAAPAVEMKKASGPPHWAMLHPFRGDEKLSKLRKLPGCVTYQLSIKHFNDVLVVESASRIFRRIRRELKKIECNAENRKILDDIKWGHAVAMPKHIKKWTILAGPKINKTAREQLEIRFHKIICGFTMKRIDNPEFVQQFEDWLSDMLMKHETAHEMCKYETGTAF